MLRYDTPLQLAVRVCRACRPADGHLKNHPAFSPAIYNVGCMLSLEVALQRLDYCNNLHLLEFGEEFQRTVNLYNMKISGYTTAETFSVKYAYRQQNSRHVKNSRGFSKRVSNGGCKYALKVKPAFTVLAGLTFSAYFQPPFGTDVGEQESEVARSFWIFNSLAVYFAVYTILHCLLHIMRSDRPLGENSKRSVYVATLRVQSAVPLTPHCVGFGVGAFVAAGCADLPPNSGSFILACTVSGLLLVFFQLLRNLQAALSTLREELYGDDEQLTRADYMLSLVLRGCPAHFLLYTVKQNKQTDIRPIAERYCDRTVGIAFVGLQLYGEVGLVLYAVIELLT